MTSPPLSSPPPAPSLQASVKGCEFGRLRDAEDRGHKKPPTRPSVCSRGREPASKIVRLPFPCLVFLGALRIHWHKRKKKKVKIRFSSCMYVMGVRVKVSGWGSPERRRVFRGRGAGLEGCRWLARLQHQQRHLLPERTSVVADSEGPTYTSGLEEKGQLGFSTSAVLMRKHSATFWHFLLSLRGLWRCVRSPAPAHGSWLNFSL